MRKKRNNGEKLTKAQLEEFKTVLLTKVKEIRGNVNSMENDTLRKERSELSNMPIHMADAGTDNFEMENTLDLMDSEKKILDEIYDALERIEEGTYGICENNGEIIPRQRLEAIPWARYCVECASKTEKRQ